MKWFVNLILMIILTSPLVFADGAVPWAVQIFTLDARNEGELQAEFNALSSRGIETVIFRSFKLPGDPAYPLLPEKRSSGVYFQTRSEPLVSDLMPMIIRCAHRANLSCFAWITTRKSAWMLIENPQWESARINVRTGQVQAGNHLDIFQEKINHRIEQMMMDLAATGVDGILVQDDLVSRQGDDFYTRLWRDFAGKAFDEISRASLFTDSGDRTVYTSRYLRWAHFKSHAIARFLDNMLTRVKSEHPDLKVAVNIYYEAVTVPQHGRNWLAQDLDELIQAPVDLWAVMSYQRQMIKELEKSAGDVGTLLARASHVLKSGYLIPADRILWKLQAQDWESRKMVPATELQAVLKPLAPHRIAVVPYRGLRTLNNF